MKVLVHIIVGIGTLFDVYLDCKMHILNLFLFKL